MGPRYAATGVQHRMALDRFITFKGKKPPKADLLVLCNNYLGGTGKVEVSEDRVTLTLPGKGRSAFAGIVEAYQEHPHADRWIEVVYGSGTFDVLTRNQDNFTNAVADGLAQDIARFWEGSLQD